MPRGVSVSSFRAPPRALSGREDLSHGPAIEFAVYHLARNAPTLSAALPVWSWLPKLAILACLVLTVIVGLAPACGGAAVAVALAIPFACIVLVRAVALFDLVAQRGSPLKHIELLSDHALPTYSVLVPVFKEAAVAPALVQAMSELDYPEQQLEIWFVTEEDDVATRNALLAAPLKAHMRVLTVPRGIPQTKPRALNYALHFASGDLIAVYDAEDIPEPNQLKIAASRFAQEPSDVVCLQARLNIYNPGVSFFTRQFTLEYAALFDAILPSLARLNLAIPLGGTSNHFKRDRLIEAGAWDPFNVTEDCDLGFRLARLGFRTGTLNSTTWEEAPINFQIWLGQRTRWLKGWMLTYGVHMRDPSRLLRELGAWKFFGFQVTLGGMVLSALVHPWIYIYAFYGLFVSKNGALGLSAALEGQFSSAFCLGVLGLGYATGIALLAISVERRGGKLLLPSIWRLPIYWLAISLAAYRALFEVFVAPYKWQKTPHAARPVTLFHTQS